MARHLLLVSIGPVQDFIAQARRTRDLWFGSKLLCDLSRAAAEAIAARPGSELIFPARSPDGRLPEGVANKILALVDDAPRDVAVRAREAARDHLAGLWRVARTEHAELIDPNALATAEEQIATALEVFAAWAPCASDETYPEARRAVEDALAGRKLLHDFVPWTAQRGGVHKSSLDGVRETVLHPPGARTHADFGRYRISEREELDAVGVLKRTGGDPGQFVPVPTIGLAAWLEAAKQKHEGLLAALVNACRTSGLTRVRRPSASAWLAAFPFDAQIFLPGRLPIYFADLGLDAEAAKAFERDHVAPVRDKLSPPFPYVACLSADGDRMGDAIHALAPRGPKAHQAFSTALAGFADRARQIVEERRGVLVYAGGDDVLAFVALPDAVDCARALSEAFAKIMRGALVGVDVPPPTLSVGLGIGHVLESLADLLALGREAEQAAKREGRDRLAIVVEMRAGARLAWSEAWGADPQGLLDGDVARLSAGTINKGKLHELEAMRAGLPEPTPGLEDGEAWARILRLEAGRIFGRIGLGAGGTPVEPASLGLVLDGDYPTMQRELGRTIARASIADVLRRGDPGGKS